MYNEEYLAARARSRRPGGCTPCASSGDEKTSWGLVGYPLASVFAPLQNFAELYDLDTALTRGTIFKELDLPFVCGDSPRGGSCRG